MDRDLKILLSIFLILLIGICSYFAINDGDIDDSKNNNSNINSVEDINGSVLNDTNNSKSNLEGNNDNIHNRTTSDSKNSSNSNSLSDSNSLSNSNSLNYVTKHSPQQIEKISTKILDKYPEAFGNSSIVKVSSVKYDFETGLWIVNYVNRKTGKYVGKTYIIDDTGKMPIM